MRATRDAAVGVARRARRQRTTEASRVVGDRGVERRFPSQRVRSRLIASHPSRDVRAFAFDRRRGNGREGRWRRRARRRRAMRGRARCSRRTGRSRARVSVDDGSARTPRRARTRRWRGKVRGDETRRDATGANGGAIEKRREGGMGAFGRVRAMDDGVTDGVC